MHLRYTHIYIILSSAFLISLKSFKYFSLLSTRNFLTQLRIHFLTYKYETCIGLTIEMICNAVVLLFSIYQLFHLYLQMIVVSWSNLFSLPGCCVRKFGTKQQLWQHFIKDLQPFPKNEKTVRLYSFWIRASESLVRLRKQINSDICQKVSQIWI